MRQIAKIIITALLLSFPTILSAQETDSTKNEITKDDIILVLQIFDGQPISTVIQKAEYFIETGKDSTQRAFFASAVIDYYIASKIMGYDEAAVYIADNYFLNGKYKYPDAEKYQIIKLYVDCNRRSLLGLSAPELNLPDITGTKISLRKSEGTYKILYFYDDECLSCKRQLPALMQYLQSIRDFKVTFYRVFTQNDRERWISYISDVNSKFPLPKTVNTVDVWDPDLTSDFPELYGVLSTPQLLVINKNNEIVGRKLTPRALSQVIEMEQNKPTAMETLFSSIFSPIVSNTSVNMDTTKITEAVDMFYEDSKDNPDFFHESMYSLFHYLKKQDDYDLQRGAAYLAKKYIVDMPGMWELVSFTSDGETKGSTLKGDYSSVGDFLRETALAVRLFYLNQLGKPATDLTLYSVSKKPVQMLSPDADFTVLYFYTIDCPACESATKKMVEIQKRFSDKNVQFTAIYTGTDKKWKNYLKENGFTWESLWDRDRKSGMFEKYDLVAVPKIYLLDKDKNTLGKDIKPEILEEVLGYLYPKEKEATSAE